MTSEYRKVDLHIHTPVSACYEDHLTPQFFTTPQRVIDSAVEAGLEAIAITDHNSAEGIDDIRRAAKGNGLVIFPGMELSTKGGHMLAIFDVETPTERLRELLHHLDMPEEQWGDGYYQLSQWMDEVFITIHQAGGVAIACHVDRQPRGLVVSDISTEDKVRIYHSPYLSALEITDARDKERWNRGLFPHFSLGRACIQGSDAHAPFEMGRRPCYLRVPDLSLPGLKLAFQEYETRISFPGEIRALALEARRA
ncbi:MAG: PHP domain-containing protein [Chloroflexi bacterium]|nr:PHP domain-containing protein [Chloroflexota bacterium]